MLKRSKHTPTARTGRRLSIGTAAVAAALALPVPALAGTFAVLSYNVRGLPTPAIEDRTAQIAAIAPLLEDFHTAAEPYVGMNSLVGLQELFDAGYYATITNAATVSYPHITAKDTGGNAGIGDGLNLLSDFTINDFTRTQWNDCFGTLGAAGSDCDTNKGFSFAKVVLEPGAVVDVYTLHADAGQDTDSQAARRKNITQLVDAINANSPDGTPVILLGDTNSLFTRSGNDNVEDLVFGAGLTDVWVQLRRSGLVPGAGDAIESACATVPDSSDCELVDKIFYRDGNTLVFAPQNYSVLKQMFSDGMAGDLSDHYPVAVTFDYATVTTTTTTTTTVSTSTSSTMSTTSTTIAPMRPCGDPIALVAPLEGDAKAAELHARTVVASDALFVLKAAVGLVSCPLCTCDTDNSGKVTASDALRVLRKAVGQIVTLNCPACT